MSEPATEGDLSLAKGFAAVKVTKADDLGRDNGISTLFCIFGYLHHVLELAKKHW